MQAMLGLLETISLHVAQLEHGTAEGRLRGERQDQTSGDAHRKSGHGLHLLQRVRDARSSGAAPAMMHTYRVTGKFTPVHAFPQARNIVPSISRKHIVSCQGICVGQGTLCPIRAELMFYLQKTSAKTDLALPSGELTDNVESIKF